MKKTVGRKLVKALRSGKYRQGTDALCTVKPKMPPAFCCLGVLTNIFLLEHGEKWQTSCGNDYDPSRDLMHDSLFPKGGDCAFLSERVMNWAGIKTEDDKFGPNGPYQLAIHNDGIPRKVKKKTFAEIADLIEAHMNDL